MWADAIEAGIHATVRGDCPEYTTTVVTASPDRAASAHAEAESRRSLGTGLRGKEIVRENGALPAPPGAEHDEDAEAAERLRHFSTVRDKTVLAPEWYCLDYAAGLRLTPSLQMAAERQSGASAVDSSDNSKGLPGARTRRRGLSDAALGTPRRHLSYKTAWYGSQLVVADRWFPSSKTCHACGHVQDIGWAEYWTCDRAGSGCGATHQRDDCAAINLACYEEPDSVVSPVGAAVKRGADRKTGPRPAGGREARKGPGHPAGKQPRDRVRVA